MVGALVKALFGGGPGGGPGGTSPGGNVDGGIPGGGPGGSIPGGRLGIVGYNYQQTCSQKLLLVISDLTFLVFLAVIIVSTGSQLNILDFLWSIGFERYLLKTKFCDVDNLDKYYYC